MGEGRDSQVGIAMLGAMSGKSPSDPGAEEEKRTEKSICLLALNDFMELEWFVFPVLRNDFEFDTVTCLGKRKIRSDHHQKDENGIEKIDKVATLCGHPAQKVFATLGSCIYTFCMRVISFDSLRGKSWYPKERLKPANDVYCFDTNDPCVRWKRVPSMKTIWHCVETAVLDGKIYLLGTGNKAGVIIEVFDPSLESWEILPPPDVRFPARYLFAALDSPKRIFLGSCSKEEAVFYIYHITEACWKRLDLGSDVCLRFKVHGCQGRAEVVGEILYWLKWNGEIVALDIEHKKCLLSRSVNGILGPKYFADDERPPPVLIHLEGDMFCLVWTWEEEDYEYEDYDDDDDGRHYCNYHAGSGTGDCHCFDTNRPSRIHCAKVRLSRTLNSKGVDVISASFASCQSYIVDHGLSYLDSRLLNGVFLNGSGSSSAAWDMAVNAE